MKQISTFSHFGLKATAVSLFLICVLLLKPGAVNAQTVKSYTPEQVTDLVTDMAGGFYDIYELETSGGSYVITGTNSGIITINRDATIRAKAGLAAKPIISYSGSSTSSTAGIFIPNVPNMTLRMEGIEFEGINANSAGLVHHLVRTATGTGITSTTATENFKLIVKNCYFHGFGDAATNKGIFRMEGINSSVDVQGSTFNNCVGRLICFQSVAVAPYIQYGDVLLKNNTFCNIPNESTNGNGIVTFRSAGSGAQLAAGNNVTVDHCTFYNCKLYPASDVLIFRTMKGLISFTNCIFDQVDNGINFVNPNLTAPPMVIDYNYLGFATPPTGTNTISTAPIYTNAAALNFGLTNRSFFVGKDGLTIGDTRYYTTNVGIAPAQQVVGFSVFPNPVYKYMNVNYSLPLGGKVKLDVYDLNGKLVKSVIRSEYQSAGKYSKAIDVSTLEKGAYFARITAGGSTQTVKLVVTK